LRPDCNKTSGVLSPARLGEEALVLASLTVSPWKGSIPRRKEDLVFVAVFFDFSATDLVFVAADLGFVALDLEVVL
jgi:hypothetical protein